MRKLRVYEEELREEIKQLYREGWSIEELRVKYASNTQSIGDIVRGLKKPKNYEAFKVCCICFNRMTLDNFTLVRVNKNGKKTYTNKCNKCEVNATPVKPQKIRKREFYCWTCGKTKDRTFGIKICCGKEMDLRDFFEVAQ